MVNHVSATVREETPHVNQTNQTNHTNQTTRTKAIIKALKQRAQAVLNDRSIDAPSRAIIRYALEINDPWLAELVRRADAGEGNLHTIDFMQEPESTSEEEEKIAALAEVICCAGDDVGKRSAALLVLISTLENASHPKTLTAVAKELAFARMESELLS